MGVKVQQEGVLLSPAEVPSASEERDRSLKQMCEGVKVINTPPHAPPPTNLVLWD